MSSGTWWKSGDLPSMAGYQAGYVNPERVDRIEARSYEGDSGLVHYVAAYIGSAVVQLHGAYASKADAMDAARKLCQGIDPTTITGGS